MKIENSQSRGFTLIELLVVIAIISLLVSILLPSLNRAKELAKRVICSSQVRHIGLASAMYSSDNDDYLPGGRNNYGIGYQYDDPDTAEEEKPDCYGVLYTEYVSDPHMFYCPNAQQGNCWVYYGGSRAWPNSVRMAYWDRGPLDGERYDFDYPAEENRPKHWNVGKEDWRDEQIKEGKEVRAPSQFAIFSDVWNWDLHEDGFNVLYADQHIIWIDDGDDTIANTANDWHAREATWAIIDEEG